MRLFCGSITPRKTRKPALAPRAIPRDRERVLHRRALGRRLACRAFGELPFGVRLRTPIHPVHDGSIPAGVRVATASDTAKASISIEDSGPGIRSGNPRDFIKPFMREEIARSERGYGLGLTIADRAVRLHGGSLRLENADSGGMRASIELPVPQPTISLRRGYQRASGRRP